MRVVSRKKLKNFWRQHADAEQALKAWYAEAAKTNWKGTADIKARYPHASILARVRVVFNIKGNKYRLVVAIKYRFGMVYIRFVGTHQAYDQIDAATI
jgi:mRNA interferase HigB